MEPTQVITSSVKDALRLGCSAIGLTLYPGSVEYITMIDEARNVIHEAKNHGLPVIIWMYPRGGDLDKQDETALDVICYSVHMACSLGANIVKVKPPAEYVRDDIILDYGDITSLAHRVKIVKRAAFGGRRLVIFSGGASKISEELYAEIQQMADGGADGSIVGRNIFQRAREEAKHVAKTITHIYSRKIHLAMSCLKGL